LEGIDQKREDFHRLPFFLFCRLQRGFFALADGVVGQKLVLEPAGGAILLDLLELVSVVVTGDHGCTDYYPFARFDQLFEIFQNQMIIGSRANSMKLGIECLDVVKETRGVWQYLLKTARGQITCGVDSHGNARRGAFFGNFCKKIGIKHTLPARESHSAARGTVEVNICGNDLIEFINSILAPIKLPCIRGAIINAFTAEDARIGTPAYLLAHSATDAFFGHQSKFRLRYLTLRVVAPFAIKVTALEKHSRPNAGAVNRR